MLRKYLGRTACLIGLHQRSRRRAREIPDGWYTRCKKCGILMVREGDKGKWHAVGRSRAALFERGVIDETGLLKGAASPPTPSVDRRGRFSFVRRLLAKVPFPRRKKKVAKPTTPALPHGTPRRRTLRVGEDGLVRRRPRVGGGGNGGSGGADGGT